MNRCGMDKPNPAGIRTLPCVGLLRAGEHQAVRNRSRVSRNVGQSLSSVSDHSRAAVGPFAAEISQTGDHDRSRVHANPWPRASTTTRRYLLPLAAKTNVGQVVSIRTLEKQITRWLSAQLPELRDLGEALRESCAKAPADVWGQVCGTSDKAVDPVAPTLGPARRGPMRTKPRSTANYPGTGKKSCGKPDWICRRSVGRAGGAPVALIEPHALMDELVTSVLYRIGHAPYRRILEWVRGVARAGQTGNPGRCLRRRGPHDELIKEYRCGYPLIFDVLMDIGEWWRDLHRHRRCQQNPAKFYRRAWVRNTRAVV